MTTHVVTPVEFDDTEIEITGAAYQHMFRAKRLRVGDELRIVDGEGRARRGVIARVDRARGVVALGSAAPTLEPAARVELLVAPPKPDRAAWLVEKATEVGVMAIRFVATERTARNERAFGAAQLMRLRRVAVAAVEQCGRALVPEVSGLEPLDATLDSVALLDPTTLALDPAGARSVPLPALAPRGRWIRLCVGPEGGWSPAERDRFAARGVGLMSLGERILRVETASVVAAGIVLQWSAAAGSVDTPERAV